MDVRAGVLEGNGYVAGNLVNGGEVRVGGAGAAGALYIAGNYTQTAAGVLAMELGGPGLGTGYDYLYVTGAATLGGTLRLATLGGFVPAPDNYFVLLTCGSVQGNFAVINGLFLSGDRALYPFFDGNGYYLWTYAY